MVSLDFHIHLPVIRKAFDAKQLQAQTNSGTRVCRYGGPCAVGVCMDEHTRVSVINHPIDCLIEENTVSVPEDQRRDWVNLQQTHDQWATTPAGSDRQFREFLEYLEAKYARPEN